MAAWSDELRAHRLPDALRAKLPMLLYKPDKNALEWKALAAACEAAQTNPVALLAECGAIPSSHDYHFNAFLAQAFPAGHRVSRPMARCRALPELPVAEVRAFSIDDATTTEIDDAFSVRAPRERPLGDRHPHRGARARDRARIAARRDRALAAVDRLHAGAQAHDAARAGRRRVHAGARAIGARALALRRGRRRTAALVRHVDARRARPGRRESAARHDRRSLRQRPPCAVRPAVDRGAARAVEIRPLAVRRARQGRFRAHRLQLLRRLGRRPGGTRGGTRAHRPAAAREPARQARLGADDLRQQQLGQAARRCARRRALPDAVERQGEDEHASRASTRGSGSPTTCGRARRCAATAIS